MADLPTSRLRRTARLGGLMVGRGASWAGTRARGGDRQQWATDTADEVVRTLGEMKGAAMKLGQLLSTVDLEAVPEEQRDAFKARLGALRDSAPPAGADQVRRVVERELGGPLGRHFADFDPVPVAAASLGQVHRATTRDGRDVAVKVQYPGIAAAVEADLRNLGLLTALVGRLAPGIDARAIAAELRARIGEELDYELEAQHQRAVHRAFRDHPFVVVPNVDTTLSTGRVLVSDFVEGRRFEHVAALSQAERDRFAEILFRFCFGLLSRERRCAADPHPGNQLLLADGRVAFLDFGLMRRVPEAFLDGERALARAVIAADAPAVHAGMHRLGYLPDPAAVSPAQALAQLRGAGGWLLTPGDRLIDPDLARRTVEHLTPRSPFFAQMRKQTIPAEALLLRRMEAVLVGVLGELRAQADWSAILLEYVAGAPPSTALGREEATAVAAVR